jgi:hypothetical protein
VGHSSLWSVPRLVYKTWPVHFIANVFYWRPEHVLLFKKVLKLFFLNSSYVCSVDISVVLPYNCFCLTSKTVYVICNKKAKSHLWFRWVVPDDSHQSSAFKTWGTSRPLTGAISHKTSIFRDTAEGTSHFGKNHSIILNFNSINCLARPRDYTFINFRQHSFCTGLTVLFSFKTTVYTCMHTGDV